AATFGLLVLLAGVAGAVVLWLMAEQRPDLAVDGFARGPVGCTTTLEFGDTGTFYVYEEVVGRESGAFDECEPVPGPDAAFTVELLVDGRAVALRDDTSVSYDTATAIGASIARIEIDEVGRYELVVSGGDPAVVAAVGRDPQQGVDELRRGAIVVGAVGIALGVLLLLLAGRRSKRAAIATTPSGPGWGPAPRGDDAPAWPPTPPRVPQVPVNPLLPDPTDRAPIGDEPAASWAPPDASGRREPPAP
ncbi:MAG: hypothetical protein ACLGHQ_01590, partial [Acidimicrobiia bacterium]